MKFISTFVLVILTQILFGQKFNHPLTFVQQDFKLTKYNERIDTFHLLAVMVEFQEDRDGATQGNGKFGSHYTKDYGKNIIDPLPHNKEYFEGHLEFLRNYYLNVSNGKVVIEYEVLDRVITLSKVMSEYAPPPRSNDLTRVAYLYDEAWKIVDSIYKNFDFNKFDVFTIFHAGVGRDISIPETFGLEKDIPSVFLNFESIKKLLGENYPGVQIGFPPKLVTNSMIIPETESREILTVAGKTLLELSINGLLAASFGSFLGLPDLFDTRTGKTAIGRFGLMDGQAMFAYAGLFPPEPSAWEKVYLGWIEPIEINHDTINVEVYARKINYPEKLIYKIPLNSREYYLIENRQRDTYYDGIKIKSIIDGQVKEYNFTSDTVGFRSYYVDSIDGVVIDVDEPDWALPGNGILIWHIDEKIISEKIKYNEINADPINKGVKLIEADGIEDIGKEFLTIFGDVVIGEGEYVDFWYYGNPSKFYKNEFSDKTTPSTKSNNGSPSFIKIFNFTNIGNRMTFCLKYGNIDVKFLISEKVTDPIKIDFLHLLPQSKKQVFFSSGKNFYNYDLMTKSKNLISSNLIGIPIVVEKQNTCIYAFLEKNLFKVIYVDIENLYSKEFNLGTDEATPTLHSVIIRNPSLSQDYDYGIRFITKSGKVYQYYTSDSTFNEIMALGPNEFIDAATYNNTSYFLASNTIEWDDKKFNHNVSNPLQLILVNDKALPSESNLNFYLFSKSAAVSVFNLNFEKYFSFSSKNDSQIYYAIGDLIGDGNNYLVINEKNRISAYGKNGTMAEGFPIDVPRGDEFCGNINLVDFNGDSINDVLVSTKNGKLICFDGLTKQKLFDYSIGYSNSSISYLTHFDNKLHYISINDSGYFQLIQISKEQKEISWVLDKGNFLRQGSVGEAKSNLRLDNYMPKDRVYNWPNPVYDNLTYIRLFVSEDSNVRVKIYDLSGTFIDELNFTAQGGIDTEFPWDVTKISSGIYFAKVEAHSVNKSDYKIIKIAVVK